MKGLVFTEFLEMVENKFSPDMVEEIIAKSNLPNQGAYTAVGTYNHQELIELVTHLSILTKIPISTLEQTYGQYLFTKLITRYPHALTSTDNVFEFLQSVDGHIHVEVRKLYPEAELPHFEYKMLNAHTMQFDYYSTRPFVDLAEGLIKGCIDYYKEPITIQREKMHSNQDTFFRFILTKEA